MSNYLISVTDLKKPIIRKDILVDKKIIKPIRNNPTNLGLLLEELLNQITIEKRKEKRE